MPFRLVRREDLNECHYQQGGIAIGIFIGLSILAQNGIFQPDSRGTDRGRPDSNSGGQDKERSS